jgi:hypothetical protein
MANMRLWAAELPPSGEMEIIEQEREHREALQSAGQVEHPA